MMGFVVELEDLASLTEAAAEETLTAGIVAYGSVEVKSSYIPKFLFSEESVTCWVCDDFSSTELLILHVLSDFSPTATVRST